MMPPFSGMDLQASEIDGRGDLAVVRGTHTMTIMIEGIPPFEEVGKWVEIRQKQADGSWLIHRDIYNSDLPLSKEE
jgi:ketosteroid isomerase-like protein